MKLAVIAAIALVAPAAGQRPERLPDLDFEYGLRGWRATGAAFAKQPVMGDGFSTNHTRPVQLGGDYWHDLRFPVGHHGKYFVFTLQSEGGEEATGWLISEDIVLTPEQRYFSLLIGGTNDALSERVELQVLANSPTEAGYPRDGDYLVVFTATGRNTDLLRQEHFAIPAFAAHRKVRIKIADDSPHGHIAVDYIRFTATPPAPDTAPAWGLADYHTHPMNYMGFGGLNNIRTVWGVPGGAWQDYEHDTSRVYDDLPYCCTGHGGGPTAEVFINSADAAQIKRPHGTIQILKDLLAGHYTSHGRYGAPTFRDFPGFLTGTHQQMHITQIHRAWEGGLRLMTAFAVHNRASEYLVSPVTNGCISPSQEREVVEAQICGMRKLADLNSDWMEIAYTPEDARRIIRENKLAIVLGIEVDQLSELGQGDAEHEIEYLWNLGIRHVFPIHAIDNKLGGAAVFEDAYNSANDLLNRCALNMGPNDTVENKFFDVQKGCADGHRDRGECVLYRLHNPVDRVVLTHLIPDFFLDRFLPPLLWKQIPFIKPVCIPAYDDIPKEQGQMNKLGLWPAGQDYVKALVKKGMLIDVAHMSEQSVTDTYKAIGALLKERWPACEHLEWKTKLSDVCYENAYPLTASHIHFRAQSLPQDKTTFPPFRPSEYEMSDSQLELMRRVGGVLGPFVAEDPIDPPPGQPSMTIKNDCAGSSKGFGFSFLYGLSKMGGSGAGLATDYTFIPSVAPRFGSKACWPYQRADHPDQERAKNPCMYRVKDQTDGVAYQDGNSRGVPVSKRPALIRYTMGEHNFDYNTEGLANYGLLPDFLQDLKNIGLPTEAFQALFNSSEDYLRMWEKAWRISGITAAPGTFVPTQPLNCDIACSGLCPGPPNNGAPVRTLCK